MPKYTISQFCRHVENNLNGLINEVSGINRFVSDTERKAYEASYPVVGQMLAAAMEINPRIGQAHISTTQMLLEYKLPGASAWCDLVLLGDNAQGKQQVVVIELKNYMPNDSDRPGVCEGVMMHQNKMIKHPADQVKGYTEYCRRFHSVVDEYQAKVDGCVYFTTNIDLQPYREVPNRQLTEEYPLYNKISTPELSLFVASKIDRGNEQFAARFELGFYKQNRNILLQVAENMHQHQSDAKPFVLLDEQRLGFNLVMNTLKERVKDGRKEVIIVEGPPGSGKSAVAINVWMEAVMKFAGRGGKKGNIVYVTTSSSQEQNWGMIFDRFGEMYHAKDLIVKSNSFNPGLSGGKMKNELLPEISIEHPEYVQEDNPNSLKFEYFREYLDFMIANGWTKNYKENLHFLSVVDEAHALINPVAKGYSSNKHGGWCYQAGPQAYHIINESQVSIFFTDGKQSFRDNESTSVDDLNAWARELGAHVTSLSLAGMQFRCAGSLDYVEWVERLFSPLPVRNHEDWKDDFKVEIVDYPSEMESVLRQHLAEGRKKDRKYNSCRILSSYTRKWVSKNDLEREHNSEAEPDFDLKDKHGSRWTNYWNNPNGYETFVQAADHTLMASDPLCEVGCPYVVRGFDYDHIGLLWLSDLVIRKGKWYINLKNMEETANGSTRKKAKDELKERQIKTQLVPAFNPSLPCTQALFDVTAQAYRILMTRAIKTLTIYVEDAETREYLRTLL